MNRPAPRPLEELSPARLASLHGIFTDIDDTLTLHGRIVPEAFLALDRLQRAGLRTDRDADLLRIRKVRATLRMQAASEALRGGPESGLFLNPGKAQGGSRLVPDYTVQFDVSPRNLNLTR